MRCSTSRMRAAERSTVSSVEHGHGLLQHDRARVEALVDEVDGGAAHLDAVLQGLALGVEARERRQQRRMHVQDPPGEGAQERAARAGACSRPGRRGRRRARAAARRARGRAPRASGRDDRGTRRGCPRARARSSPGASSTFEITTAISPPSAPARRASIRACRLEPRPLMRTPISSGVTAGRARSLEGDAAARHHGADHEARLAAPLERVLDVVEVLGRHDRPPCRSPC